MSTIFGNELRDYLSDMIGELGLEGDIEIVTAYLSGSLAVGLGNAFSDIDIIVIHRGSRRLHEYRMLGDYPVDILYWQIDDLREGWARLSSAISADNYGNANGWREDLSRYSRLHLGMPVLHNDAFACVRDEIDLERLAHLQQIHFHVRAATYLRDAVGALASGDLDTAWDTSLATVRLVAQAALSAAGDLYLADKFVLRRISASTPLEPICGRLRGLIIPNCGERVPADLADIVRNRLRLSTQLSALSSMYGPRGGLDRSTVQEYFAVADLNGMSGFAPATDYGISIALDDEFLISGSRTMIASVRTGVVWALRIAASKPDDIHRMYRTLTGEDDDTAVNDALDELNEAEFTALGGI
ncbi:nucleotidyltransferase domain-containing protein [Nocardia sp. NPDC051750]|uniref:nucleotidyltransferase domain-containing protein n=1 Tax=Nocardia sp. NPDC051750 TaxID=3364325 RepID=UPI0037B380A5